MHDIPVLESDAVMGPLGSLGQMSTASDDFALSWVLIDQDTIDSIVAASLDCIHGLRARAFFGFKLGYRKLYWCGSRSYSG